MERAVKKEWNENAWRGSPAALADLFAEVERLVKQSSGGSEDPGAHITVKLPRREGDLIFRSVGEFEEYARDDGAAVARARVVHASIGNQVGDVGVRLILHRVPLLVSAVSVAVRGRNPVAVNGVCPEVKALLRIGGQRVPSWAIYWGVWLVGFLLMFAAPHIPALAHDPVWIAGLVLVIGAFGFGLLSPFLWPQFEVIAPGAPESGAARARRWLGGSARWLLAAVAGAFIYAAVDHLL